MSKILKRAYELEPDVLWAVALPAKVIIDNYGEGFLLTGNKGKFSKEYFILEEDPRKDNWIHMIANELEHEVNDAT